ncbi:hypothetical protein IEO21_01863 [Rhodonia placenta]|uniref:Uncharacterized protein n=1 Tax=Rhodonia placenta TaxID=104341 RepID=A0A8H7U523_9APHY|nr:hypothetical protein IEO21_01863 [Postia placenta]
MASRTTEVLKRRILHSKTNLAKNIKNKGAADRKQGAVLRSGPAEGDAKGLVSTRQIGQLPTNCCTRLAGG